MPIKSFRGKIAHDTIERVNLATNNGTIGYRIHKFEIMSSNMNEDVEHAMKIFSTPQTTATPSFDFSDPTLLAAAFLRVTKGNAPGFQDVVITFDNVTFNQDIYITHDDVGGATVACNYHIELEQVKLDLNENTVATLKDIRNIVQQ
jgi:hypothetical protein